MLDVLDLVHQLQVPRHACLVVNIGLLEVDYVFVGRLSQPVDIDLAKGAVLALLEQLQLVQDVLVGLRHRLSHSSDLL